MSARERVETRCEAPGRWVVEGWNVWRGTNRIWRARNQDGVNITARTLEEICGEIIDRMSDEARR